MPEYTSITGVYNMIKLQDIKRKVQILYVLNVVDMICTLMLLKTGHFIEVNLLLKSVVQEPIKMVFIKVLLPILLLFYLYQRIKKASPKQLKISNIVLNGAVIFYGLVNIIHVFGFLFLMGIALIC